MPSKKDSFKGSPFFASKSQNIKDILYTGESPAKPKRESREIHNREER